jgi:membrane-bound metal-dependent hydrolase YbcI (DUF457 family)
MALCLAHAGVGYLVYEIARPAGPHRPALAAAAVALGIAPDLDFVPGLLVGQPGAYHRGVTHTIGAAVVAAVVVLWVARRHDFGRPWAVAGWAWAVWMTHLLLDWVAADVKPPHGGRFLWPLSQEYFHAPVTLLPEIVIDGSNNAAFVSSLVGPHTWAAWASDAGVLVAAFTCAALVRRWRAGAAREELAGLPEGT